MLLILFTVGIIGLNKIDFTAAADTSITFGVAITDRITFTGETKTYSFSANTGDVILIMATGEHISDLYGDYHPQVRLLGPTGIELAQKSGGTISEISALINSTGTYTIIVRLDGATTGSYGLFVQKLNNPQGTPLINFGQTLVGRINFTGDAKTYFFSANIGDIILIKATGEHISDLYGDFHPQLKLYGPNGIELIRISTGTAVSEFSATMNATGTYTLIVNHNGTDARSYGLFIQRLNNNQGRPLTNFGESLTGRINFTGDAQPYFFSAKTGDTFLMIATGQHFSDLYGDFHPRQRLYNPEGGLIAQNSTTTAVSEISGVLSATGIYTLIVDHATTGTGSYGLFTIPESMSFLTITVLTLLVVAFAVFSTKHQHNKKLSLNDGFV